MHKLRKAAVLVAAIGSVGLLGAGTANAQGGGDDGHGGKGGGQHNVLQSSNCKSHDLNIDILGQVGLLNGLLGNGLNGEGKAGSQDTHLGSSMGCDNKAF
ncbi:hypothetical protein [Streptomyces albicerus]|uniref:hypothetical protein n=1 Tax=Streptomyces albicerus TaxID=2569859 RepID=UPI00124B1939|nr:hypothetical protein [Streptomyces albicerus]